MNAQINVREMMRADDGQTPSLGNPIILMRIMVRSNVGVLFSLDQTLTTNNPGIVRHLSVCHPTDRKVDVGWILPKFVEVLGEPKGRRDRIFRWTYRDQDRPGVMHHFFWAA